MPCVLVTGVNGVGKSTVVAEVLRAAPDCRYFSASTALMDHFGLAPGDYSALDSLPLRQRISASHALLTEAITGTPGPLLLDAHLLTFERVEPVDCGGPWISLLRGIVLLTASAAQIDARLRADALSGRTRRWLDLSAEARSERVDLIARRQRLLGAHTDQVSASWGVPALRVTNEGDVGSTATAVLGLLTA
ncbi:AAA family ATPase [Streptomyces physcomitrii]|uniref:ATP-binding protein n=1 Tax=Streptomyces physcomitrii TaxID=2724184 RepID=A0ABX1H7X8_9ACTN|nr:ATP-binding protein [Streptomyces physcomitrii]